MFEKFLKKMKLQGEFLTIIMSEVLSRSNFPLAANIPRRSVGLSKVPRKEGKLHFYAPFGDQFMK